MHSLLLERMALRKPRKHGLAGILLVVGWVLAVLRASLGCPDRDPRFACSRGVTLARLLGRRRGITKAGVTSAKDDGHVRYTHSLKRGQVRSKDNVRQSLRLAALAPQCRTHDDVVAAYRGGADRLGLCNRPVPNHLQQVPGARPAYLRTALALISCGILALVISLWQYLWTVRYL